MSNHDGFAVVAQVRDKTINECLTIYHRAGVIPNEVSETVALPNPVGGGNAQLTTSLYLDAPNMVFEESRGAVLVRIVLAGTISITGAGIPAGDQLVRIDAEIVLAPTAVVDADGARVRLQSAGANLTSYTVTSVQGALPQPVIDFLNSAGVRNRLRLLVSLAMAAINSIAPPLMVPFLDQIGLGTRVNIGQVRVKVLNGGMAVCLDYTPGTDAITTNGNLNNVASFLSQSDIALCAHPINRLLLARTALPMVQERAAEHNATVSSVSIHLMSDHMKIVVKAAKDGFDATITLRARVELGRPETVEHYDDEYGSQHTVVTPGTDDVWVKVWNVEVDADIPWWVYLLITVGVFIVGPMGPVAIAAVVSVVDSITSSVANRVGNAASGNTSSRVERVQLPGTEGPFIDITISQIKTSPDGFQTRAWFRPVTTYGDGKLSGPQSVPIEEAAEGPTRYTLSNDLMRWDPQNPLIDIRWQVRRLDTNQVVLSRRRRANQIGARRIDVDFAHPDLIGSEKYKVNVAVLRRGSPEQTILTETLEVRIVDRLDRSRPFVRWRHTVCVPECELDKSGVLRQVGWMFENRESRIHKTKVPGRCRMAGRFSDKVWPINMLYMDELPFSADDLVANREELCDYCFFGGPDKFEPLPL